MAVNISVHGYDSTALVLYLINYKFFSKHLLHLRLKFKTVNLEFIRSNKNNCAAE